MIDYLVIDLSSKLSPLYYMTLFFKTLSMPYGAVSSPSQWYPISISYVLSCIRRTASPPPFQVLQWGIVYKLTPIGPPPPFPPSFKLPCVYHATRVLVSQESLKLSTFKIHRRIKKSHVPIYRYILYPKSLYI